MTVSLEAGVSNEGDASETTHVEALTPKVREATIQTWVMVVDLIHTNAACEKCVFCVAAQGEHGIVDNSESVWGSLATTEILHKRLHAFSFD